MIVVITNSIFSRLEIRLSLIVLYKPLSKHDNPNNVITIKDKVTIIFKRSAPLMSLLYVNILTKKKVHLLSPTFHLVFQEHYLYEI